jgi:hypothetical protein
MITKKPPEKPDVAAGEKKSTATPTVTPAGQTRVQAPQAQAAAAPPGPPFTAGTPISVTPYTAPGRPPIYMVAGAKLGSEEDVLMTLKNQLFKPAVKLT